MAYASITYTSASGTTFALTNSSGDPIEYLRQNDISVTVNGVLKTLTTDYTFNTAGTAIVLNTAVSGATVLIARTTDIADATVSFTAGSTLTAQDLNNSDKQNRFALQEFSDVYDPLRTGTGDLSGLAGFIGSSETWVSDNAHAPTTGAVDSRVDSKIDTALTTDVVAGDAITVTDNSPSSGQITIGVTNASISTAKLVDSSVTTVKIADGNVTTAKILDSNVTTAKIADSNVTTVKIADGNVTTDKLANSAITDAKIASGIDGAKLTAATVDSSKLTGATVVTNSEVPSVTVNDTSFFTTSAADRRYFRQDSAETIDSGMPWSSSDGFIATTAAIDARVIDLVDDVGGFVPIANETSFPVNNPDINNPDNAGTIISIKEIVTTRTPSSGTVTIANGAGSNTVTITGCGSTVLASGFGVLVETTTTLHTYSFHRLVPKATEVTTVASISGDITTVAGISSNVTTVATNNANVTTVATNIADIQTVANDLNEPVSEIDTVATNIANVNTVGTNIANVNTVVTNLADIQTVANDLNEPVSEIDTVATNIANVNTVGNNITNVNTVATNNANVTTVAGSIANVNTNATNIANINTVAGISADVTTVAGNNANVTTVAGSIANVNTTAGSITSVNTVSGSIANVNTVATNIANVNNASTYLNNFLALYLGSLASDPSVDTFGASVTNGDLYFNNLSSQLRVYNGSSWQSFAENQFVEFVPLTGNFNTIYTGAVGTNTMDLGDLAITGAVFPGENVPAKRVALATGSSSYNLGNL